MSGRSVAATSHKMLYTGTPEQVVDLTETSQMVKGGRKSTVRGALYEGTSIAAVYGTDCRLQPRVRTMKRKIQNGLQYLPLRLIKCVLVNTALGRLDSPF